MRALRLLASNASPLYYQNDMCPKCEPMTLLLRNERRLIIRVWCRTVTRPTCAICLPAVPVSNRHQGNGDVLFGVYTSEMFVLDLCCTKREVLALLFAHRTKGLPRRKPHVSYLLDPFLCLCQKTHPLMPSPSNARFKTAKFVLVRFWHGKVTLWGLWRTFDVPSGTTTTCDRGEWRNLVLLLTVNVR